MTEPNSMRLAILIDAENVQPVFADTIFSNAQAMGEVCAKEIFGAASALTTWVEPVLKYAIHPNLTIKAAKGKNSSDIALVIGAMDLVVKGDIDGVVIASSDSDFSSLSVRLRTAGLQVIGMGTEKANALWRTACSSFIVLETPAQKAAQAQKAQVQKAQVQKPQNQKPAPAPAKAPAPQKQQAAQSGNARPAANASHKERAAAIEQVIQKRLSAHGGRVQVSYLFPILKKLPEYNKDRQDVGKKPLNYLTSTFGDAFDFEETDGKMWVSLKGWQPAEAPQQPEPADEPKDEAAEAEAAEVEVVEAVSEPEEAPAIEEVPAEPEPEVEEEPQDEEPQYEEPQDDETAMATRMLTEGGMAPEVAAKIVEILSTAADKRAAYNAIRKVYGNVEGRNYYNQAKEILENRA